MTKEFKLGTWFEVETIDEMSSFYLSRLEAMRVAAIEHGYALGLHGSTRRDLDVMAMPWREDCSSKDVLAEALQFAACGIRCERYTWEKKPRNRYATSFAICWPKWFDMVGAGCVDLSVVVFERTDSDS